MANDDTEIRSLLYEYLQKQSYRATAVADGKGLRAAVATSHPDLITLDLMLPGEDGLTLCRELRAKSEIRRNPPKSEILIIFAIIGRKKAWTYVGLVALFSASAGMTCGAWVDGTSLWTLALGLAEFVVVLATLLFVAGRNIPSVKGV